VPRYLLKLDRKLRCELDQTLDQIETLWFQKARVERIRDGDRNTKYFHTATIIRRRNNRVNALRDCHGNWCTDERQIKEIIVNHFQQLFTEDMSEQQRVSHNIPGFLALRLEQRNRLSAQFTEEDVHQAVKVMDPFKAPGPDGYQVFFFQEYWHIVKEEVCNIVLNVLRGQSIPEGMNATFLTLIPKVSNVETVN